jgi:hypothetical protein
VSELLIGTSPTYREVHARSGSDSAVYSVAMASYDAGSRGEEWMNRDYLAVPQDKVASISVGDVVLERKDGKFTLAGLKPEDKPKETAISELVGAVAHPSFDLVQGKGKDALAKLDPADIQVTVKRTEGDPITYKFKKEATGGAYLFASSAHDFVFRVAEASISPIVKAKRETLIETKAAEAKDQKKDEAKTEAKDQKPQEAKPEAKASEQKPEAKAETAAPKSEAAQTQPPKQEEAKAPDKEQKPEAQAEIAAPKPETPQAQSQKQEEAKDQNKPVSGNGG